MGDTPASTLEKHVQSYNFTFSRTSQNCINATKPQKIILAWWSPTLNIVLPEAQIVRTPMHNHPSTPCMYNLRLECMIHAQVWRIRQEMLMEQRKKISTDREEREWMLEKYDPRIPLPSTFLRLKIWSEKKKSSALLLSFLWSSIYRKKTWKPCSVAAWSSSSVMGRCPLTRYL